MGYGQQKILLIGLKLIDVEFSVGTEILQFQAVKQIFIESLIFFNVDPNPAHQLIHPKFDPLRIVN